MGQYTEMDRLELSSEDLGTGKNPERLQNLV
jgi:hypothetical protein